MGSNEMPEIFEERGPSGVMRDCRIKGRGRSKPKGRVRNQGKIAITTRFSIIANLSVVSISITPPILSDTSALTVSGGIVSISPTIALSTPFKTLSINLLLKHRNAIDMFVRSSIISRRDVARIAGLLLVWNW